MTNEEKAPEIHRILWVSYLGCKIMPKVNRVRRTASTSTGLTVFKKGVVLKSIVTTPIVSIWKGLSRCDGRTNRWEFMFRCIITSRICSEITTSNKSIFSVINHNKLTVVTKENSTVPSI